METKRISATEVSAALSPPSSSAPEPLRAAAASCKGWASVPTECSTSRAGRGLTRATCDAVGGFASTAACFAEEEQPARDERERGDSEQGESDSGARRVQDARADLNAA